MTYPPTDLQVIARSRECTDTRDRRSNNTGELCQKLANMRDDLLAFASDPLIIGGVAYSVADRLDRAITELRGAR
jgi:hypothetical protein